MHSVHFPGLFARIKLGRCSISFSYLFQFWIILTHLHDFSHSSALPLPIKGPCSNSDVLGEKAGPLQSPKMEKLRCYPFVEKLGTGKRCFAWNDRITWIQEEYDRVMGTYVFDRICMLLLLSPWKLWWVQLHARDGINAKVLSRGNFRMDQIVQKLFSCNQNQRITTALLRLPKTLIA